MRELFQRAAGWIDDPQRRGVAATMLAPAAGSRIGLSVGAVGKTLAVRRPGSLDGYGLHQLALIPAFERYFIELSASAIRHFAVRYEQDPLPVRAPPRDEIRGRMPCQAAWLSSRDGNDVHVDVVVVGSREGDPASVRLERRVEFGSRVRREAEGPLTIPIAHPDVSGIDKGEMVLRDGGLAQ